MYSCIDFCVADIRNQLFEAGSLKEHEKVRMIVEHCALLEYFNGQKFTYRAVNIYTLQSKYLFYRSMPLEASQYNQTAERMLQLGINMLPEGRRRSTKQERAGTLLSYIFTDIMPLYGFTYRNNQRELALHMLEALQGNKLALSEAAVGTGKTHAYILAVVIHNLFSDSKMPAIVSTSTIALQKAITEEYLPQISTILTGHKIIEAPLSFVVRKGKTHYLCDSRLKTYRRSIEQLDRPQDEYLRSVLMDLTIMSDCGMDLDKYELTRYVKARICVDEHCNGLCENCRYLSFIQRCLSSYYDFQITNHNFVLANILNRKSGRKRLLPDYQTVIFDEAHKLPDTARQMYGGRFASTEIPELAVYLLSERQNTPYGGRLVAVCDQLVNTNKELFQRVIVDQNQTEIMFNKKVVWIIESLIEALNGIASYFIEVSDRKRLNRYKNIRRKCRDMVGKLRVLQDYESLILWREQDENENEILCSVPKNLSAHLYRDIWDRNIPYILTSGTLSANGSFYHIKRTTGIDLAPRWRITETSQASPFHYHSHMLIYLSEEVPFPNIQEIEYVEAVTLEIRKLIYATKGHTLVLFTSYWLMERIFNLISGTIAYPLFLMGKGEMNTLDMYRESKNGVLFASDTAGEGIDLAGDILSSVIIVKLPFPIPDAVSRFEQSQYENLQQYLREIVTPSMLIKLKQYVGRAIRRETDTAVVSILDSRVNQRGKYREAVLEALPDAPVTGKIEDVIRFITDKKCEEYFDE